MPDPTLACMVKSVNSGLPLIYTIPMDELRKADQCVPVTSSKLDE
jgi:hypothetical protein